ncbi:PEP-utilizing enzyme, partial [Vagococcus salmoninarum]
NLMKIQLIGSKLLEGQGIGRDSLIATSVVATSAEEANKKAVEGCILVVKTTDKDYMPAIELAGALVVEDGGLTSHAAVVGIAKGIPVIVGAKDATTIIADDTLITVDPRHGVIFNGAATVLA